MAAIGVRLSLLLPATLMCGGPLLSGDLGGGRMLLRLLLGGRLRGGTVLGGRLGSSRMLLCLLLGRGLRGGTVLGCGLDGRAVLGRRTLLDRRWRSTLCRLSGSRGDRGP